MANFWETSIADKLQNEHGSKHAHPYSAPHRSRAEDDEDVQPPRGSRQARCQREPNHRDHEQTLAANAVGEPGDRDAPEAHEANDRCGDGERRRRHAEPDRDRARPNRQQRAVVGLEVADQEERSHRRPLRTRELEDLIESAARSHARSE